MYGLIWANTYVPGNIMENSMDTFVGNAEVFNTGQCVSAPQLSGVYWYGVSTKQSDFKPSLSRKRYRLAILAEI